MTPPGNRDPSRMSAADLAQAQSELTLELVRLSEQLSTARADTGADLDAQPTGGDPADMGDRVSRVEHDAMVLDNERRLLQQTRTALKRIENGTYENCESCTNLIGAARLQAFPRATMCLHCRQLADHHH